MGHDRGFGGGGRERHFDNGELRFVILQLIADKPSYGYEIIKAIEERLSGAYAPSPRSGISHADHARGGRLMPLSPQPRAARSYTQPRNRGSNI